MSTRTEKFQSLAIILLTIIVGVQFIVLFNNNDTDFEEDPGDIHHGDTDIHPPAFGEFYSLNRESIPCTERVAPGRDSVLLNFTLTHQHEGDTAHSNIIMKTLVYENGNPLDDSNVEILYTNKDGDVLTLSNTNNLNDTTLCSSYGVISVTEPANLEEVIENNITYQKAEINVRIVIKNIGPAYHTYDIKFVFPNGGLYPIQHGYHENFVLLDETITKKGCQMEDVNITVCPVEVTEILKSSEIPRVIEEFYNSKNAEWPRFQLLEKDGEIHLVPYQKEDFEKK